MEARIGQNDPTDKHPLGRPDLPRSSKRDLLGPNDVLLERFLQIEKNANY